MMKALTIASLAALGLVLTACGPGQAKTERAVGVDTPLGQSLTKSQWCTPATTEGAEQSTFTTLDLRQNGKYIRSSYALGDDRSLHLRSKEQGKWSLLFDQLYTQANVANAPPVQSSVAKTDPTEVIGSAATAARPGTTGESCVTLTNVSTQALDTFCTCDFVKN